MMKRLRTVIIGCGNIAGRYDEGGGKGTWSHAKAYRKHGGFDLVAAWDPSGNRLEEFCAHWGVPGRAAGVEELLRAHSPEVVSICSPSEAHYEHLMLALRQRSVKAVLCEKPLALSTAEARQAEALAAEAGVEVLVNYLRRWDPLMKQIGEELASGKFGEVTDGRVLYTKGVFHNASHAINWLARWLGPVTGVKVERREPLAHGDVLADFSATFSGRCRIRFQGLDHRHFNHFEIDLLCREGRLRFPGVSALEIQLRKPSVLTPGEFSLGAPELREATISTAMEQVVENLYDVVAKQASPVMSLAEAAETVSVCTQVKEAKL